MALTFAMRIDLKEKTILKLQWKNCMQKFAKVYLVWPLLQLVSPYYFSTFLGIGFTENVEDAMFGCWVD